ncbi:MAG: wax ester/triacylglycerol synthase family O-acyltransferase [Solirubrobacteraceae bacterium]
MNAQEAMGSADAAWLRMDRPTNLMVINSVFWFDEPVDWARFAEVLQTRLVEPFPRFSQRVAGPRLGVGGPHWEDDPAFDLDLHLHRVALPAPGDRAALQAYVADRMVTPLDPTKPLWHVDMIDGYGKGCAVLARLHHCIADGISLARVLLSLTDERPDAGLEPPQPPAGDRRRGGPVGAVLRPAGAALSLTRGAAGAILHEGLEVLARPKRTIDLAAMARDDAQALAKLVLAGADAKTALKGELGVAQRVAWTAPIPLAEIRDLAHAHGATINDVLVAAMTGALRRYLESRDSLVEEIHAVVPFNLRPLDEPLPRRLGNRFGLVFLSLPVGVETPGGRLAAVKRGMAEIKSSPEGPIAYAILSALGTTPSLVESALVDLFSSKGTAVMTNVPGPRQTVYLAGSPVRGVLVWAPCSGNMSMSVSILSYHGEVTVGLMTDAGLVPDPDTILDAFDSELDSLKALPPD